MKDQENSELIMEFVEFIKDQVKFNLITPYLYGNEPYQANRRQSILRHIRMFYKFCVKKALKQVDMEDYWEEVRVIIEIASHSPLEGDDDPYMEVAVISDGLCTYWTNGFGNDHLKFPEYNEYIKDDDCDTVEMFEKRLNSVIEALVRSMSHIKKGG